jgi:hypothetical protein
VIEDLDQTLVLDVLEDRRGPIGAGWILELPYGERCHFPHPALVPSAGRRRSPSVGVRRGVGFTRSGRALVG